jgi:hypothetical protein
MPTKLEKTVDLPKFDEAAAYNHDRPISSLIRTQLLHLHTAENLHLPPEMRTNININNLHTEREASEYIAKVTGLLHQHGKAQRKAEAAKARRKAAPKRRTASQPQGDA